ncbi:Ankyrin repeat-containing protein [Chishuiella changwenlii]|uniref:Ankyrin repeat-containing protein n=1 Tax=Chishuiella changwenlii TaxID=1434701 RepID=A0A1M6XZQ6_9FLAO|nr:ankyrin repeat domain-containing protein [Chishuiella changwenlii]GGE93954.1 hypothetical protein GCM10010984_09520 [Chishuiella changwenlii]SHL11481.1 Ankyrin repeat-containing protein [Chishuiella changwenlii]
MSEFNQQNFFNTIYNDSEEELILYLTENYKIIPADKREQLLTTVMQNKKWKVFDYMIDHELINTELFEYDSFDDRLLSPIISQTKYFNTDDLAEYLPHFEKFLNALDDINEELAGYNILSYALENGFPLEIVEAIFQNGIKQDFHNRAEQNYLHIALSQRQNRTENYTHYISSFLIDNGIDVNKEDIVKKTPLYVALENNYIVKPETIKLLLDNGADVNAVDNKGISPLFYVSAYSKNLELLRLFLEYGTPDFNLLNKEGENLLNGFLKYSQASDTDNEMLMLLLDNGATLSATSKYYDKEKSGLDWVIEKPSELLKLLLDKDLIDVNEINNDGQTILIKVCQINPNYEEAVAKDLYRKVRYLLKAGADSSIEDRFDKKAIDYAMGDNMKSKIVETLLEK